MSADHNRIAADAVVRCDHIPNGIRRGSEMEAHQLFGKRARPLAFAERRSCDFRKTDLLLFDLRLMVGDKAKGLFDAAIAENLVYAIAHYLIWKETDSDSITGWTAMLPMTL